MASFVEQATLRVVDQSSGQINKINAALKRLQATANSLRSRSIDIRVNARGLQQALTGVQRLTAAMRQLQGASRSINIGANANALNQAANAARRYANAMQSVRTATVAQTRAQTGLVNAQTRLARAQTAATAAGPQSAAAINAQARLAQAHANLLNAQTRAQRAAQPPAPPVPPAGGGRGGRGGGRGRGGSLMEPTIPRAGLAFAGGLGGFSAMSLVAAIAAIGRAAREGISDADIGKFMIQQKQLNRPGIAELYGGPGAEERAFRAVQELGEERREAAKKGEFGEFFNIGQRQRVFAEILGSARDISAAKIATGLVESLSAALYAQGKSFSEAEEGAALYFKTLEQMGRATFRKDVKDSAGNVIHKKGDFDEKSMRESFEYLNKLMPTVGKELTGSFFKMIGKYLGPAKFPISNRALGALILMGEEGGAPTAAVGYRQAVKQLSGLNVQDVAKREQMRLGIAKYEKQGKRLVLSKDQPKFKDEATGQMRTAAEWVQTDLPGFVRNVLVPKWEEDFRKALHAPTVAEVDRDIRSGKIAPKDRQQAIKERLDQAIEEAISDPQKLYEKATKVVSDSKAQESIMAFAQRAAEFEKTLNEADRRAGDFATLNKLLGGSIRVSAMGLQNSFQSALGQVILTQAPNLISGMNKGAEALGLIASRAAEGKPLDMSMMKFAIDDLMPMMTGAALMAMMDPSTAPMGAAGLVLLEAGRALISAAQFLAQAAGKTLEQGKIGYDIMKMEGAERAKQTQIDKVNAEIARFQKGQSFDTGGKPVLTYPEIQAVRAAQRRKRPIPPAIQAKIDKHIQELTNARDKLLADQAELRRQIDELYERHRRAGEGDKFPPPPAPVPTPTTTPLTVQPDPGNPLQVEPAPGTVPPPRVDYTQPPPAGFPPPPPMPGTPGVPLVVQPDPGNPLQVEPAPGAVPPPAVVPPGEPLPKIEVDSDKDKEAKTRGLPTTEPKFDLASLFQGFDLSAGKLIEVGNQIGNAASAFSATFSEGAATLAGGGTQFAANAVPALAAGGSQFGSSAAGAINPAGLGAAMGSAARAQLEGITINVNMSGIPGGGGANPSSKATDPGTSA
jgi:hypothetical protein